MHNAAAHQIWATVSSSNSSELMTQVNQLIKWGVHSIEFRLDLVPIEKWDEIFALPDLDIPWWVAHFGVGSESKAAKKAVQMASATRASGVIFHSKSEFLNDFITICRNAKKAFAAPYHSQRPLDYDSAIAEYAYQESLKPAFRKIAVRCSSYKEAADFVDATHAASQLGGTPVVGAVFGDQRWARIALPKAGSSISFISAEPIVNELGDDDQQFTLVDISHIESLKHVCWFSRGIAS